jgi:hypothetical protein
MKTKDKVVSYCPNCYCGECEEARIERENKVLRKMCDRWNWNSTPGEVARDIRESKFFYRQGRVLEFMREYGFNAATIEHVRWELCPR